MKRNYTVSQDPISKLWYAHQIGFAYIPYFGSFCEKKSDAMEYAKMLNNLPHRVEKIEREKHKRMDEIMKDVELPF